MSFIEQFGGNKETGRNTGLAAVRKAVESGMTINEIRSQLAREGIATGSKATEYLAARPATSFIAQYGGNEETFSHSGYQALERARQSGLSDAQIRAQAAAEGVSFGYRAEESLRQSSIADSFKQQLAAMQAQRQAELDAMQRSFAQQMAQADQEARRRARELQIAQQTQMANVARGSAEGQFKLGTQRDGKGVAAFKRRLQITPATAQGLSIATNAAQSTNMLNV